VPWRAGRGTASIGGFEMSLHRRLTTGDLRRMIAELRAQLPDGYDPWLDHWAAPYDCDCCADVLDEDQPETGWPRAG